MTPAKVTSERKPPPVPQKVSAPVAGPTGGAAIRVPDVILDRLVDEALSRSPIETLARIMGVDPAHERAVRRGLRVFMHRLVQLWILAPECMFEVVAESGRGRPADALYREILSPCLGRARMARALELPPTYVQAALRGTLLERLDRWVHVSRPSLDNVMATMVMLLLVHPATPGTE